MEASFIILNYKNKNLTKELLRNFKELKLPFSHEIIVVDNASYDGVEEVIHKNYPDVKFVQSKINGGFAYGNNLGIEQAKGKYIFICNPDLAILSDAFLKMYQYMETHPEVGLAGPRLINADKSIQYSCTRFPDWHLPLYRRTSLANSEKGNQWLTEYLMQDIDHSKNIYVPALFGACLIARRSAIDKVGKLDERFFMYMEDIDWSRRFWESGYKVAYIGQAEVIHLHRRESANDNLLKTIFSRSARNHISSFIKYLRKYKGRPEPKVS